MIRNSVCPADTAELAAPGSAALAGAPAVAAAHHLYSRGPASLQSPMSRASLAPTQVRCQLLVACAMCKSEHTNMICSPR